VVVAAIFIPAAPAAQSERTAAALVMVEPKVELNDRAVEPGALPSTLSDPAVVRTADQWARRTQAQLKK
jgi:hypothetical protein